MRSNDDRAPLSFALYLRKLRTARVLLQGGADVNQRGCEPFVAPWADNRNAPAQLKETTKNPACAFANGITPLMWSSAAGDREAVELLLEFGADRSLRDWAGQSARDYSTSREITELLVTEAQPPSR